MPENTLCRSPQRMKLAGATTLECPGRSAFSSQTATSRSASRKGGAERSTPWTTVKIAVAPPMPRASVATVTAVKPGLRRSVRAA